MSEYEPGSLREALSWALGDWGGVENVAKTVENWMAENVAREAKPIEPKEERPRCEDCLPTIEALWRLGAGYEPDWAILSGSGKFGPPPASTALRQAIVDRARERLNSCEVCG